MIGDHVPIDFLIPYSDGKVQLVCKYLKAYNENRINELCRGSKSILYANAYAKPCLVRLWPSSGVGIYSMRFTCHDHDMTMLKFPYSSWDHISKFFLLLLYLLLYLLYRSLMSEERVKIKILRVKIKMLSLSWLIEFHRYVFILCRDGKNLTIFTCSACD